MCKGTEDYITRELQERLKTIFPSLSRGLTVFVYSKGKEDAEWYLEIREDSQEPALDGSVLAEYEETGEIYDSRIGEWGKSKQIKWEIRMSMDLKLKIQTLGNHDTKMELEFAPLEYFFKMILEKLSIGLTDCWMFDRIKNGDETAVAHLFKEIPKMSSLLSDCVDEIMKDNGLPNPAVITQLSAQTYEKRPVHGSLVFLSEEKWKKLGRHEENCLSLEAVKLEQRKLEMENMRCFRKMIEMNSAEVSAVVVKTSASADSENSWHMVGLIMNRSVQDEDVFWVDFNGTLTWSIRKNHKIWFLYKDGRYKQKVEEYLELDYQDKIRSNAHGHEEEINAVIKLLQKEKHGTSIVFFENTDYLKTELEWFHKKNRCIKLAENGVDLKKCLETMQGITAIDGALMADYSGRCYAIGVIFDGDTIVEGQVSRGARFNSVSNYVQVVRERYGREKTDGIIGVIVSEDESVDVRVPDAEIDCAEAEKEGFRIIRERGCQCYET